MLKVQGIEYRLLGGTYPGVCVGGGGGGGGEDV